MTSDPPTIEPGLIPHSDKTKLLRNNYFVIFELLKFYEANDLYNLDDILPVVGGALVGPPVGAAVGASVGSVSSPSTKSIFRQTPVYIYITPFVIFAIN